MPIGDICHAASTMERLFVKLKSFPEMEKIWKIFQVGGGKARKLTVAAIRRADAARDPQQTIRR
jgi:hypothetical protein